jgi:hypothetical protein
MAQFEALGRPILSFAAGVDESGDASARAIFMCKASAS